MTPSILLVEDDDDTARLIAELLEATSSPAFHVLTASSATEALGIVAGTPVDCVLLDYDLPDRNGLECLPDIRRRKPSLPVLMMTGVGSEDLAVAALKEYGATDYIPKRGNYWMQLPQRVRKALCRAVFREEPDGWRIGYAGCERHVPPLDGFRYIHRLLLKASHPVPATALASDGAATLESVATDSVGRAHGLRIVHDLGHRGRALDAGARAAYKARLYDLAQRRRDARARGDAEADREIDDEADCLQKELNRVRRAGGWDGSARDLARVRVARAIDRALERISKRLPALGDHLCSRVEKGYDCRYLPDPSWPIEWEL